MESLEGPSLERYQLLDMAWAWIQKKVPSEVFQGRSATSGFFLVTDVTVVKSVSKSRIHNAFPDISMLF